jgi:hypothetical protein
MEFNFEFLSPAESDGSYFDSYFEGSPPPPSTNTSTSTTTMSHDSPKCSLVSIFTTCSTPTSYPGVAGGPGAGAGAGAGVGVGGSSSTAGGAVPRSSDATMTEGYVKPPESIHHWLEALQPSISATLDKAHHHGCLTGGENSKITPVSDLVSCIIYHHFCGGLDPAARTRAHSVTSTDDILH